MLLIFDWQAFQRIVSEGISAQLLQWKGVAALFSQSLLPALVLCLGIEATERLAKSSNSKIIVMGNSKDSLPVLLSSADDASGTTKARSPVAAQGPSSVIEATAP